MSIENTDDNKLPAQLEWSLYENGMDSIQHGIEHYFNDMNEHRRYKYAILHMSQGVILLLKERLRREHPNFIFTNVADETKTADVDMTISRLKKIAHVEFTDEQEKVIRELADLRNKIEHFALTISKQQADNIISRLLPFLISFTRDELGTAFRAAIGDASWQNLIASQEHRANVVRDAEHKLHEQGKPAYHCPDCDAYTATLGKEYSPQRRVLKDEWILKSTVVECLVCNETICRVLNCRGCGKQIQFQDVMACDFAWCESCTQKLKQDFPEFYPPYLWLIGELRKWFSVHDSITGEQIYELTMNVRGPGSGFPSVAYELFHKGFFDFVSEYDRKVYNTMREHNLGFPYIEDGHTFKWSYPIR